MLAKQSPRSRETNVGCQTSSKRPSGWPWLASQRRSPLVSQGSSKSLAREQEEEPLSYLRPPRPHPDFTTEGAECSCSQVRVPHSFHLLHVLCETGRIPGFSQNTVEENFPRKTVHVSLFRM